MVASSTKTKKDNNNSRNPRDKKDKTDATKKTKSTRRKGQKQRTKIIEFRSIKTRIDQEKERKNLWKR